MSVIVKGMEMPVNCFRCPLDSGVWKPEQGPFILCRYTKGKVDYDDVPTDRRLPCCGLKEMPEKHGRLIDADDMERFMSDTVQGDIRQYPYSDTLWDMAFKWIDSRPTIVEAEGE